MFDEFIEYISNEKFGIIHHLKLKFDSKIKFNEYENNERNPYHSHWCWTLYFLKILSNKLKSKVELRYCILIETIIEFLKNKENRIIAVLSNTEYIDHNRNDCNKSLAYLQELYFIIGLLSVIYDQSKKWMKNHLEFYMTIINTIMNRTYKLFQPNIFLSNYYIPVTNFEKELLEVVKNVENQNEMNKNSSNSLFYYSVISFLNNILKNIANITLVASKDEIFRNSIISKMKDLSFVKSLDQNCQSIIESYVYSVNMMENLVSNSSNYTCLFNASIIYYNNVEATYSFHSLNSVYTKSKLS